MKRKFTVIINREGDDYVARCPDVDDAVARASSKEDALEKIRAILSKKLDDGSDGGAAPMPDPVTPSPRGPRGPSLGKEASEEKHDV